jgi:hypothetical protein
VERVVKYRKDREGLDSIMESQIGGSDICPDCQRRSEARYQSRVFHEIAGAEE